MTNPRYRDAAQQGDPFLPSDHTAQALDSVFGDRIPVVVHASLILDEALDLERLAGLRLAVFNVGEAADSDLRRPGRPVRGEVADGGAVLILLRVDDLGLLKPEREEQLSHEGPDQP